MKRTMDLGMSIPPEAVLLATSQYVASNTTSQSQYCNVAGNTASGGIDIPR